MNEQERRNYLDEIFYEHQPVAQIHLLRMMQHQWFEPYGKAVQGDNTSWIPRSKWNRKKTIDQWLLECEQWILHHPRELYQMKLFA